MPKPHPKNCWMQGFEADKIRPQFLGCQAYNPVTIPICYHGSYTKSSIPHNLHSDSNLQKQTSEIFFPFLGQRHIEIYFSTGTKLKDSSIPRHCAMSTDNCYWPFKKSVPSSSRSVSMALDHRKLYTSAKLLWKPQIWQAQNTIHTHTAPNNIHLWHMMLQAGASPLQAETDVQEHLPPRCFGHVL
jgi:hypothetical protein